ncbi:MAG: hypothetical protein RMK18_10445 [Armatimonadota bacterium]|nr:hypothetical protein [Armatimonadota bacterium]MCX7778395.1 hypothetical protein [Armatimonadota bacterium]MDW8026264.1 hypothetical protein [Armatimonadota bacterium]
MRDSYGKLIRWLIAAIALLLLHRSLLAQAGVEFVFPQDGLTVHEKFKIVLRKANPTGYIALWLNGQFLTAVGPPFEHEIDPDALKLKDGEHELRAEARDGDGRYAGSATIRFRLARQAPLEVPPEGLLLSFKFRPGEVWFYTVKAGSKAKGRIPKRARTEDLPFLEHRLTLRWNQMVQGISPDRYYQVSREVEDGRIWFLAPSGTAGVGMMGGAMGPMGGEAGAATSGAQMFQVVSLPLQPMRKMMLASMESNGSMFTNDDIDPLLAFATAGIDIEFPDFPLRVGNSWEAPIAVRPELFFLSVIRKPEKRSPSPTEAVIGTIRGDVRHMFSGFEWQMGKPCAKIVTSYELEIKFKLAYLQARYSSVGAATAGGAEVGAFGGVGMMGMPMGSPMMGVPGYGGAISSSPLFGGMAGGIGGLMGGTMAGAFGGAGMMGTQKLPEELKGSGKGTRTIYFDVRDRRIISSREEVELIFNTDTMVLSLLVPQMQTATQAGIGGGLLGMVSAIGQAYAGMLGAVMEGGEPFGALQPMGMTGGIASMLGTQAQQKPVPVQLTYTVRIDTTFDSARNRRDWIPAGLKELLE